MNETRRLAAFCAGLTFDRLPAEVVQKAKTCILDYVANVYGSLELDAVSKVVSYVRSLGGPEIATALGCGFRTGIHQAAFVNGVTAEAIEAQDGLRFGGNHSGTAVIPAALAVAEERGLGGKEVIEAVVAGYETANRISAAVHPSHTLSGFLPTGTCGTFGAACAAARLMGLDEEGMLNALGNAGYVVPLSMGEQLMGGFTVKIIQGGQAASSGLTASGLARAGITGAPHVLEGSDLNGGFTQITIDGEPALDRITDRLGEHYTLMDVYFKPYTACRHTHGAAQAVLDLVRQNHFDPEEVEALDVHTYGIALLAVGKPVSEKASFVTAQFSIPYVVSATLLDRELGPRQLTEARVADPVLLAFSEKVKVHCDDELNQVYPEKTSSRVEITFKGGRKLVKQIDIPKGDPRDPMTLDDLKEKVRHFAGERDKERLETVINGIADLENMGDISELTELV
jgi:2-methylcitrate dehydratase PrpD